MMFLRRFYQPVRSIIPMLVYSRMNYFSDPANQKSLDLAKKKEELRQRLK